MTDYEREIEELKLMCYDAHSLVRRTRQGICHGDLKRFELRENALRDAIHAMEEVVANGQIVKENAKPKKKS